MNKPETQKYEFDGLLQDVAKKPKGSLHYNGPHTAFTILTKSISNEVMNALVFGGVNGAKICLKIEVVKDKS